MGMPGGIGVFKMFSIVFFAIILVNILAGAIGGAIEWKKTGDKTKFIDSTLGQIIYFDGQIAVAMEQITNDDITGLLPEGIRKDYRASLAKQVMIYLGIFFIIGFLLFRLLSWTWGKQALDPTTDLLTIAIIVDVLFFSELLYAWLMNKPHIFPFRGFYLFFSNLDAWWGAISGTFNVVPMEQAIVPMTENVVVLT